MIKEDNIIFNITEDGDSHCIVYLHHGKVIVVTGNDKYDAVENLQTQIAIEESKER
jgi:hypothetical protein